jgi:hypothetical protein
MSFHRCLPDVIDDVYRSKFGQADVAIYHIGNYIWLTLNTAPVFRCKDWRDLFNFSRGWNRLFVYSITADSALLFVMTKHHKSIQVCGKCSHPKLRTIGKAEPLRRSKVAHWSDLEIHVSLKKGSNIEYRPSLCPWARHLTLLALNQEYKWAHTPYPHLDVCMYCHLTYFWSITLRTWNINS